MVIAAAPPTARPWLRPRLPRQRATATVPAALPNGSGQIEIRNSLSTACAEGARRVRTRHWVLALCHGEQRMRDGSVVPECAPAPRQKILSPALSRKPRIPSARGATTFAACLLLAACAGETPFQSDFARTEAHTPPIGREKTGTTAADPVSDQPAPAPNYQKNVVECAKELGLQADGGSPYKLSDGRMSRRWYFHSEAQEAAFSDCVSRKASSASSAASRSR
jgi:hypothetical protein